MEVNRTNEYQRFVNEDEFEFVYRICKQKDVIGSWKDVCKILNEGLGYEYGESRYRKMFQSFEKMLRANASMYSDGQKQLEEITNQIDNLKKERYKLHALNLSRNRELRQDSRFDLFYEQIARAASTIQNPDLRPLAIQNSDKKLVLGMGDIHYGANFTSLNNTYSREICVKRFRTLLSKLISIIEREDISDLDVINVSDTVQGILRYTDLQINEIPIVEAVIEVSRIIATFLNELSAYTRIRYIHVPSANHTQIRPLGSKANEIASEDMEKIIVNYIRDVLKENDRIDVAWQTDDDAVEFKIFDFNCVAIHGHQIKNVSNTVKDLSNLRRRFYDYVFCGHRHSANEIISAEGKYHNIELLTCPAFIGSDPHSDRCMVGAKPMVKLYEFDRKEGHVSSKNLILNT